MKSYDVFSILQLILIKVLDISAKESYYIHTVSYTHLIYTQHSYQGGHYNHIDTINKVKYHGSIPAFIEKEGIDNGIIYSLSLIHIYIPPEAQDVPSEAAGRAPGFSAHTGNIPFPVCNPK